MTQKFFSHNGYKKADFESAGKVGKKVTEEKLQGPQYIIKDEKQQNSFTFVYVKNLFL